MSQSVLKCWKKPFRFFGSDRPVVAFGILRDLGQLGHPVIKHKGLSKISTRSGTSSGSLIYFDFVIIYLQN